MLPVLSTLAEHFVVTERFVQARGARTWDHAAAGCTYDRSGRFPQMSISYVNRRWLEGLGGRPLTSAERRGEAGRGGLPFGSRDARGELCETPGAPSGCPGFAERATIPTKSHGAGSNATQCRTLV
eukprot:5261704-Prymnesium_polylepis.1